MKAREKMYAKAIRRFNDKYGRAPYGYELKQLQVSYEYLNKKYGYGNFLKMLGLRRKNHYPCTEKYGIYLPHKRTRIYHAVDKSTKREIAQGFFPDVVAKVFPDKVGVQGLYRIVNRKSYRGIWIFDDFHYQVWIRADSWVEYRDACNYIFGDHIYGRYHFKVIDDNLNKLKSGLVTPRDLVDVDKFKDLKKEDYYK